VTDRNSNLAPVERLIPCLPPPCSARPDRGGLTLACDGALAEPQPAMGTSIKRILEAEAAGGYTLEQLQLPAGWSVHTDDALERRLSALGVRPPLPSSRRRQSEAKDQALLDGRLRALRARADGSSSAENGGAEDGGVGGSSSAAGLSAPLDRDEQLLAGRLAALRARTQAPDERPPGGGGAVAEASSSTSSGARLVVLDDRGAAPPLTAALLARVASEEGTRAGTGAGTVLLLTTDDGGLTEAEERCVDALGGTRARVGPLVPLLANHCIVLAHAALDAEAASLFT